ncbi:MAG: hypothetical protein VX278_04445 [Myxococcota bacterium]|nr:hypothetical protein [Myxococcota bacterium]
MLYMLMFAACNSINTTEAELVFDSLFQPISDIRDLVLEEEERNADISVSLSQGSNWEGTIEAQGQRQDYPLQVEYTVEISFADVYVTTGDLYINGTVESFIVYTLEETDSQSYSVDTTLSGNLNVTGDVGGTAKLDYTLSKEYDYASDTIRVEAQGKISGTDVSEFTKGSTE